MAFDTSHIQNLPKGLDPEIVKRTHQGRGWGAQDQARYDAEIGKKMKGSDVKNAGANRQEKLANMDQHIKGGGYLGGVAQRKYDRMESKEQAVDYKKQYTDHFNKVGTSAEDTANLIADYERNTKGLDPAKAFKALEGGRQFDPKGGDGSRYAEIQKRGEAKERAGNFQANSTDIKNTQTQNVNQDNDQSSSVTGDNNYVYQNQDNSIRNYGGDNRSFVYNSNGGEGPDTPATMATLAGYYAPNDSHGAQAARLDRNVTMNRDNQKKYANTSHIAEGAIARANRNSFIDPGKLDERAHKRSQYHRDQSTIKGAEIFGDIYGLESPTWNSADVAKPVEKPDFEKMYDKYTDF